MATQPPCSELTLCYHAAAGFPDCVRAHPELELSVEDAAMDLVCTQRPAAAGAIRIGCVGDSITAGVHSSGGNHTYPGQLQILLDEHQGKGKYSVTNMGACGSMMLKKSCSPFWQRPQYKTLVDPKNKWDIIIIMLGTNDAHNTCSGKGHDCCSQGTSNWGVDCGGPNATSLAHCQFADDFTAMVKLVKTLGSTPSGPKVYAMTPPPLMSSIPTFPTMQTTINVRMNTAGFLSHS